METLYPLIILLPLIGSAIIGLTGFMNPGFRKQEKLIGWLATASIAVPFLLILHAFFSFDPHVTGNKIDIDLFTWMRTTTGFEVNFSYQLDQLSLLMGLIVTGVGSLIHIYSIGYMHGDPGYYKFFSYLNLFIFAMNNLILGDNMVVMFLGWEGVGLWFVFADRILV